MEKLEFIRPNVQNPCVLLLYEELQEPDSPSFVGGPGEDPRMCVD